MLSFFRKASQTWVFKILFALLIVSFGVWGIGNVNLSSASSSVATVGDRKISMDDYAQALQREMQSASQRLGRRITIEEAKQAGLPQILLARLIRDEALDDETHALGISADDASVRRAVMKSPSFQGLDGKFDQEQYKFVLSRLGFRPDEFEADMRASLARDVLQYGVAGAAPSAPGLADAIAADELEQRRFSVLRLTPGDAPAPAAPEEAALSAYLKDHQDAFTKPESRSIRWLAIAPEEFADKVEVPEAELRQAYEDHQDRFMLPERRTIAQLAFPDEAAATAALARITAGETTFAGLAEERGLTVADATYATGPADAFPEAMAKAGFALTVPGAAGPIEGAFGPSLIAVTEILPAGETPFEEAEPLLRVELAATHAQEKAVEAAETAADQLASGASLNGVAEALGLPVHAAPEFTRAGDPEGGTYGTDPQLIDEAFAAVPGEERDLVETATGGWVLVAVDGISPAAPLTLDEAREAVTAAWEHDARLKALAETADATVAALNAREEEPEAAAARLGVPLTDIGPIRRDAQNAGLSPEHLRALFAVEPGKAAAEREADAVVIAVVRERIAADLKSPSVAPQVEQLNTQLAVSVAQDMQAYFAAAVQERANATIRPDLVDEVVGRIQ